MELKANNSIIKVLNKDHKNLNKSYQNSYNMFDFYSINVTGNIELYT